VILLALLCGWTTPALGTGATEAGRTAREKVRAAFVYNFCKFVQWPPPPPEEIPLGVLAGSDAPDFSSLSGKSVREAPIRVRIAPILDDLADCRLLYLPSDGAHLWEEIRDGLDGAPVLTISDMEGFCEQGGMIQLVERQGRLRFHINRRAAEAAGLTVSSQLLKMAKIVEGGD
jgi:hypothetical protein